MSSADLTLAQARSILDIQTLICYGGAPGAWVTGGPLTAVTVNSVTKEEGGLQVSAVQRGGRGKVYGAQLSVSLLVAGPVTASYYVGVIADPTVPPFSVDTRIERTRGRVFTAGRYYAAEFLPMDVSTFAPSTIGVFPLTQSQYLRQALSDIRLSTGKLSFVFTSAFENAINIAFTTEALGIPIITPKLSFDYCIPAQGTDNDMSVTGPRYNERWFKCSRCDFWFPLSRSVRDEEKRGLLVCDSGCADKRGRKDTRKPVREREDRLWPRL